MLYFYCFISGIFTNFLVDISQLNDYVELKKETTSGWPPSQLQTPGQEIIFNLHNWALSIQGKDGGAEKGERKRCCRRIDCYDLKEAS